MSVEDVKGRIDSIKRKIERMMRDRQFRREGKFFEWKCKYSEQLLTCSGELNVCKKIFELVISETAKSVRQGLEEVRNVELQKLELKNAAIGYMIMDDATFALRSVNSYDAINMAYESLDMAERRLKGESPRKNLRIFGRHPERGSVQSILENADIEEERLKIYSAIESELTESGNIEQALKHYREKKKKEVENKAYGSAVDKKISESKPEPDKDYETEEDRKRRINEERGMAYSSAPPQINKKEKNADE